MVKLAQISPNILTPIHRKHGGGGGFTSAWSPLGNFIEGQAHPNVFAFLQFSSNQVLSIFLCRKVFFSFSHVFFVFAFRWFRVFHRGCYVYFPMVLSSNSLYILYIFIFIYFLSIFSLYSGLFDLCWVISL